jgi:hypothetical protein
MTIIQILILLILPKLAFASGTAGGYFLLATLISIPSFIAMIGLYFYVAKASKNKDSSARKVWVISFLTLLVCGVCITGYGGFAPNWLAFREYHYIQPIISSLVLSIVYIAIFNKKQYDLFGEKINEPE